MLSFYSRMKFSWNETIARLDGHYKSELTGEKKSLAQY